MIKNNSRFFSYLFVLGLFCLGQTVNASAEKAPPHLTTENAADVLTEAGEYTFDSIKFHPVKDIVMSFLQLANAPRNSLDSGKEPYPKTTLPIHLEFFPASDDLGKSPATIYLPGSAGLGLSEQDEINYLHSIGEHVFVIKTNYSHVKFLHKDDKPPLAKKELIRRSSTTSNQLNANPFNQVADFARLYKIMETLSFIDLEKVTLLGDSLGGVATLLASQGEFLGPLFPGAKFMGKTYEGTPDPHDWWIHLPNVTYVARWPIPAMMPLCPKVYSKARLLVFAGADDDYCEPEPMIHAARALAKRSTKFHFELLEGVGHFPGANREEYEARTRLASAHAKSPDDIKILYDETSDSYKLPKGQNISGSCFSLGQPLSDLAIPEGVSMDDFFMEKYPVLTFFHNGRGAFNLPEKSRMLLNREHLSPLLKTTTGTSIKPDPRAIEYVRRRTEEFKRWNEVEAIKTSLSQTLHLLGYDGENPETIRSCYVRTTERESYLDDR